MTNAYVGSNQVVKIMIGDKLVWSKRSVLSLDFVNQIYSRDGQPIAFSEAVNFTRASKAWLVTQPTITEYDENIPRISSKGLLIEQEATNYARWSFLPENGEFSRNVGTLFNGSNWQKAGSPGAVLYVNSLEAISEQSVASITATTGSNFSKIVINNAVRVPIKRGQVYYFVVDSIDTRFAGISWDAGENYSTSSIPLAFQIEKGSVPSSPIKTTTVPVTRLADILALKAPALSVAGDWDSTLSISLVGDKLIHTGYGYIRSLVVS